MGGFVHEVAITSLTCSRVLIPQGYSASLGLFVEDPGTFTETFNVTFYAGNTAINTQTVTLTSGNSTNITFLWNTSGFAYGNYTLSAYAWPVSGQTDLTNNNVTSGVVKVTIPGDLNGDFQVNLKDLAILAKAYGSTAGDANWNPNADIDGDGLVGLSDLGILVQHYGQICP
jgi:hypothetical protein